MVSGKASEELPPGWKEYVKVKYGRKIKYFINSATGQKFYSRKGVFRAYSQEISRGSSTSASKPDHQSLPCKSKVTPGEAETNGSTEWLPHGWTVESRTRLGPGSVYKIYIDPLTGRKFYSKPQVMRYLQGIEKENAGGTQQRQMSEEAPLKHQDMYQSVEGKINLSGENKNVVEENYGLDVHPPGCTKVIKTRKRVREQQSQASEALEGKNHIPGKNENNTDKKPSPKIDYSDVQQKNGFDELPPGWIKETKTRKSGRGMREDPYYIDTASGYAFRSKKDVMRYLGTKDISCCAIKPQKWDVSELKLIKEDAHPQTSTMVVVETENFGDREKEKVYSVPALTTKLPASTIAEPHLGSGTIEHNESEQNSCLKAEALKQDRKIVHDNAAVDGNDTDGFHEKKLRENCPDTKTDLRKSKKRKPPSTPCRSSKRLAGQEPEMMPNFRLTERNLRAEIRKLLGIQADSKAVNTVADQVAAQHLVNHAETTISSSLALNTAADEVPLQPVAVLEKTRSNLSTDTVANEKSEQPVVSEAETLVANHTSVSAAASFETDLQNNFKMHSQNQVLQQTTGLVSERQFEENPMSQGDYWSDPCWDFAFKTLTGAIPLDETLTLPGCFPEPTGTSYSQESLTFALPEYEMSPIFQNDVQQTAPIQNIVPADQLSTNPTLSPPGNISLPGCSSQPSLGAQGKDYQTKVKS